MDGYAVFNPFIVLALIGGGVFMLLSRRWPGPGTTLANRLRRGHMQLYFWAITCSVGLRSLEKQWAGVEFGNMDLLVLSAFLLLGMGKLSRLAHCDGEGQPQGDGV